MGFWNKTGTGVKKFLLGKPDELKKIPTGTKEQKALHNQILKQAREGGKEGYQNAQDYYNDQLDPSKNTLQDFLNPYQDREAFQQFSEPYMTEFEEQILPKIAERFAGAGALSSSSFGQALGGAASGLQSQLAQLFSNLIGNYQTQRQGNQQNAANSLTNQYNNLSQTGLNHKQFAYNKKKGNTGFLPGILGGVGAYFGGPAGAQIGNQVGQQTSEMFQ